MSEYDDDINNNDEFWSVALMVPTTTRNGFGCGDNENFDENDNDFDQDGEGTIVRMFTILPPAITSDDNNKISNKGSNKSSGDGNNIGATDGNIRYDTEYGAVTGKGDAGGDVLKPMKSLLSSSCLPALTLKVRQMTNDGILSDVGGIPWDASFLLAGYLFGTFEGRRLCRQAIMTTKETTGHEAGNHRRREGGILELGSGIGIAGLAAAAAGLAAAAPNYIYVSTHTNRSSNTLSEDYNQINPIDPMRVVLTDRNDPKILSNLRSNVTSNFEAVFQQYYSQYHRAGRTHDLFPSYIQNNNHNNGKSHCAIKNHQIDLKISVQACDWHDISSDLLHASTWKSNVRSSSSLLPQLSGTQSRNKTRQLNRYDERSTHLRNQQTLKEYGPFRLIIGSALVYTPDHAHACADTVYCYLSHNGGDDCDDVVDGGTRQENQAIILQLPDRDGFTTHFLPRCYELGMCVSCRKLEEALIHRIQSGLQRTIPSWKDYRMYFLKIKNNH